MIKNDNMETRIKRYHKLREQIAQEIKMIELKNENNKKVLLYKKKLARIDPLFFERAHQQTDKNFSNFQSFIQMEKVHKKSD